MQSNSSVAAIKELAERNAMEVVSINNAGGDGLARRAEQIVEFQRRYQNSLSDKEYTAVFHTYNDWFMAYVEHSFDPNSSLAVVVPTTVDSVKDGDEIYRPNAEPMNETQWEAYLIDVEEMAKRFAHEVAILAATGGDAEKRMSEQQMEAAEFSLGHGLNAAEREKENAFYKVKYIQALQDETSRLTSFEVRWNSQNCREIVEAHWKEFLTFAAAGSSELGKECIIGFEERINDIARGINDLDEKEKFLSIMKKERDLIFNEYSASPDSLKRRLGVQGASKSDHSTNHSKILSGNQFSLSAPTNTLGNLVVRTAVRATVWESILSMFRFLR